MSTSSTNSTKPFETKNNDNHLAETLSTRIHDIQLPPLAAEGPQGQNHTAPLSAPQPRSVVLPLCVQIPPNAIPDREIELVSLLEDLKMLTNKLAQLESSHQLFGTDSEDMIFRPIENVAKMIKFMEDGLVWMKWTLLEYETAVSVPNADPVAVEVHLDRLRVVMDEFFRQMYENDNVVHREFRRIVELEDADYQHLNLLLAGATMSTLHTSNIEASKANYHGDCNNTNNASETLKTRSQTSSPTQPAAGPKDPPRTATSFSRSGAEAPLLTTQAAQTKDPRLVELKSIMADINMFTDKVVELRF
ncbi:hypothetical protein BG015_008136 [Linnemannia schmuckeri]|uniref:Uncharacterized protein n=1 Tax=Linnemannia schmuckeri TaxID=64567 RepID=A0A9P5S884_9FUNG|nr:hypothetical protein BG015_008136 [Linnemannia schmuckeri]